MVGGVSFVRIPNKLHQPLQSSGQFLEFCCAADLLRQLLHMEHHKAVLIYSDVAKRVAD